MTHRQSKEDRAALHRLLLRYGCGAARKIREQLNFVREPNRRRRLLALLEWAARVEDRNEEVKR